MKMLRPLFALFERSLREQSRLKSTFVARTAIGFLLVIIIGMNESNLVNRPAPGLYVLSVLTWVNFFAITIFGLGTFASAITEEKEEDGLGLMLMTQLNPLAILLGKSTARLFDGLMLLAVQVPFTMLCVTLGGVSRDQILRCYAILASFLFLLCNVSLLWSVLCRNTNRAASMTTLTGVLLYIVPWFFTMVMVVSSFTGKVPAGWYVQVLEWMSSINPVNDLAKTTDPRGGFPFPFAADSIHASLAGGVICFALAWLLFGPCCGTTDEAAPRRIKRAGKGPRRRFAVPRPGMQAIAWKDFHFLGGGFPGIMIRGVVYVALVAGFLRLIHRLSEGRFQWDAAAHVLSTLGLMAFSVELGLVGARMFGIERKNKTLGGLYTLPLGTAGLIGQKILGALPTFIPSAGIYLAGVTISISISADSARDWSPSLGAFTTFVATECIFFAVLVLYLSLRMQRAVLATAIGGMFLANFLLSMFWDGFDHPAGVLIPTMMFGVLIAVIASLIPGRLEHAAAEE